MPAWGLHWVTGCSLDQGTGVGQQLGRRRHRAGQEDLSSPWPLPLAAEAFEVSVGT